MVRSRAWSLWPGSPPLGSWEGRLASKAQPTNNAWMTRSFVTDIVLRRLTDLPDDLLTLEEESVAQGFSMMQRLRSDWHEGGNQFAQEGEMFVGAFDGERLVGVGGLNIDPYAGAPDVGRLRHIYVLESYRRSGIGAVLVRHLLAEAASRFKVVRLWTGRASEFYGKLGFDQVSERKVTHQIAIQ
jgi:N-acetylglutamate synthase-like GNAT family acetyltransferase